MPANVETLDQRITAAIEVARKGNGEGIALCEALRVKQIVKKWTLSHPSSKSRFEILRVRGATSGNISLLDGLWSECKQRGVDLTTEQKVLLYQDFLDEATPS